MKWTTPWRVLIGDRAAIMEAAGTRWTLLVGFILVLSASLARKYDTVDLLAEPYELLHGVAASMVNAMGLHLLFWMLGSESPRPGFWRSYLAFLGVFMLAAPMGWVYGVPYEQFLPAPTAVSASMWSLAAVSFVRVMWMTRVLNVLWGVEGGKRQVGTFFAMMVYCDAVAIVALIAAPIPTLDVMGGLQQPEEVRIVASTAFLAGLVAVVTGPIWLLVGGAVLWSIDRRWSVPASETRGSMPRGAVLVSFAAVVAWASLLPTMQTPVQNRTRYESLLAAGKTAEAVHELCGRERSEYPSVWNPPPRFELREDDAMSLLPTIAKAIRAEGRAPGWVDEMYGGKMIRWSGQQLRRRWDTIIGPRPGRMDWDSPTEMDRANSWSGLDKAEREATRTCLEFIRDRVTSLSDTEHEEVRLWIKAGFEWEEHAPAWDKLRDDTDVRHSPR